MNLVLACRRADRIPFVPAIYEHKAALIGKTPSEVAQSEELLVYAALAEFETYRPDLLTVGMDVYNVEAEALGCKVKYYDTHAYRALSSIWKSPRCFTDRSAWILYAPAGWAFSCARPQVSTNSLELKSLFAEQSADPSA
jgi:hypothetical protein